MGFDGPNFYNLVCCFETSQDVVVLKTDDNSQIIKRISKIQNREIRVSGDNSEYDSRYYSQKFNSDSVLGKVFFKI